MAVKLDSYSVPDVGEAIDADRTRQQNYTENRELYENEKERKKRCPLCNGEYPEQNNYCRIDGSRLERTKSTRVEGI